MRLSPSSTGLQSISSPLLFLVSTMLSEAHSNMVETQNVLSHYLANVTVSVSP